jgi:hypothetical protein
MVLMVCTITAGRHASTGIEYPTRRVHELWQTDFTWELENAITEWVAHYNHERYHESLDNVTPADVYNGRRNDILDRRSMIKSRTLMQRKVHNRAQPCTTDSRIKPL